MFKKIRTFRDDEKNTRFTLATGYATGKQITINIRTIQIKLAPIASPYLEQRAWGIICDACLNSW